VRLDVCVPLDLVAIGNRVGKVFVFSLSGTDGYSTGNGKNSNNSDGSNAKRFDIKEEIAKFNDESDVDKAQALKQLRAQVTSDTNKAQNSNRYSSTQAKSAGDGSSGKDGEIGNSHGANRGSSGIVELFECSHYQTPKTVLTHPK
jgi:hypothetical protein